MANNILKHPNAATVDEEELLFCFRGTFCTNLF